MAIDLFEEKHRWVVQAELDRLSPVVIGYVFANPSALLLGPAVWDAASDLLRAGFAAGSSRMHRLLDTEAETFAAFAAADARIERAVGKGGGALYDHLMETVRPDLWILVAKLGHGVHRFPLDRDVPGIARLLDRMPEIARTPSLET